MFSKYIDNVTQGIRKIPEKAYNSYAAETNDNRV